MRCPMCRHCVELVKGCAIVKCRYLLFPLSNSIHKFRIFFSYINMDNLIVLFIILGICVCEFIIRMRLKVVFCTSYFPFYIKKNLLTNKWCGNTSNQSTYNIFCLSLVHELALWNWSWRLWHDEWVLI